MVLLALAATQRHNELDTEHHLQLPHFLLNVSGLVSKLKALPEEVWSEDYARRHNVVLSGRKGNVAKFKPGVEQLVLLFSSQDGENVYRFPYYDAFAEEIDEILLKVLANLRACLPDPETCCQIPHEDTAS